jgi:DNA-binding transcriptional regulator YhcF (GntR family)
MKIWLSKNSEISIHEQLVAQISLGIASYDLQTGAKLPSTREIARRFQVHPNTVNAAYKELADEGLVEFRKGSGVFVRGTGNTKADPNSLDQIIARFLHETRRSGFDLPEVRQRLKYFLELQAPENFLVVESDADMREVLIEEIRQITNREIFGISREDFQKRTGRVKEQIIALYDEQENIQPFLQPDKAPIFLKLNSVSSSMTGQTRPSGRDLIAVVSHWERFLKFAKTFLLAAQIEAESLILRSTKEKNWRSGLDSASMIICDSLTAQKISKHPNLRVFRLISDESLDELKHL